MFKTICLFFTLLITTKVPCQRNIFTPVYPIGESPNIGYKSNMATSKESITFEANPTVRLPIVNNIQQRFMNGDSKAYAWYLSFRPQLRMYNDVSMPVKMPSYRISIFGYQRIWRLSPNAENENLIAFSLESGHFSNGQSGCAFSKEFEDGSPQCDSVYALITPSSKLYKMLNRTSGNFSTNYSEMILNYRRILEKDDDNRPLEYLSFMAGADIYHDRLLLIANIGGFSDEDIKIYGKVRWLAGVEYLKKIKKPFIKKLDSYSFSANLEQISNSHPSVKKSRIELKGTLFLENNLGFFVSGIWGHDNYNFRFLDHGSQVFAGLTYQIFPRIQLNDKPEK